MGEKFPQNPQRDNPENPSRRKFLKVAAATAAGLVTGEKIFDRPEKPAQKTAGEEKPKLQETEYTQEDEDLARLLQINVEAISSFKIVAMTHGKVIIESPAFTVEFIGTPQGVKKYILPKNRRKPKRREHYV